MKKILGFFATLGMVASTSTAVVACNSDEASIENTVKNLQKTLNKVAVETEEKAIDKIKETAKNVENVVIDESILPTNTFQILFITAEKESAEVEGSTVDSNNILNAAEHSHEHIHYIITYKKSQLASDNTTFSWSNESFTFEVELHVG